MLTGADDEQFKRFHLDQSPYPVFTLKHNPEKTDRKYWEILLNKYDLEAYQTLYFEHNAAAADTAQAVGIPTYYYNHKQADLAALKAFIDANINR